MIFAYVSLVPQTQQAIHKHDVLFHVKQVSKMRFVKILVMMFRNLSTKNARGNCSRAPCGYDVCIFIYISGMGSARCAFEVWGDV